MKFDVTLAILIFMVWVSFGVAAYFTKGQFSSIGFLLMSGGGLYMAYMFSKKIGLLY